MKSNQIILRTISPFRNAQKSENKRELNLQIGRRRKTPLPILEGKREVDIILCKLA